MNNEKLVRLSRVLSVSMPSPLFASLNFRIRLKMKRSNNPFFCGSQIPTEKFPMRKFKSSQEFSYLKSKGEQISQQVLNANYNLAIQRLLLVLKIARTANINQFLLYFLALFFSPHARRVGQQKALLCKL